MTYGKKFSIVLTSLQNLQATSEKKFNKTVEFQNFYKCSFSIFIFFLFRNFQNSPEKWTFVPKSRK